MGVNYISVNVKDLLIKNDYNSRMEYGYLRIIIENDSKLFKIQSLNIISKNVYVQNWDIVKSQNYYESGHSNLPNFFIVNSSTNEKEFFIHISKNIHIHVSLLHPIYQDLINSILENFPEYLRSMRNEKIEDILLDI